MQLVNNPFKALFDLGHIGPTCAVYCDYESRITNAYFQEQFVNSWFGSTTEFIKVFVFTCRFWIGPSVVEMHMATDC